MTTEFQTEVANRTANITKAIEAGYVAIVGLHTLKTVAKFHEVYATKPELLRYAQIRFVKPGVKYRTNLLTPH